jgi:hypothetical protein
MLLGGLYASDALTTGRVYDIPLEQAYSELASMEVPGPLLGATAGVYATSVSVRRLPQAISWQFQVGGVDVASFTARLSPEAPGRTRVRVEYTPGEPLPPELQQLTSATLTRDFARIAMSEQVDAQLEHRPVDEVEMAHAMARHAAAHPEQVQEYRQAAAETVAGLYRQANENAEGISADQ